MKKILLSIILILVLIISIFPHSAYASVDLNMRIENGVLHWDTVAGSKGYDINIYDLYHELVASDSTTSYLASSYAIYDKLDAIKADSNEYLVSVTVKETETSDYYWFGYASRYPKLEAPTNLRWEGNAVKWDAVENADGYEIELYSSKTNLYNTYKSTGTSRNFSNIADVLANGWYFKIRATSSTGNYRSSVTNEGPHKGSSYVSGVLPNTTVTDDFKLKVLNNGYIGWDAVTSVKNYTLSLYTLDDHYVWDYDDYFSEYTCNFNLTEALNNDLIDSGKYEVYLTANLKNGDSRSDSLIIEYVSPFPKLEAPNNLKWNGNKATWNAVAGATGYEIDVYDEEGCLVDWFDVEETEIDFLNLSSSSVGPRASVNKNAQKSTATHHIVNSELPDGITNILATSEGYFFKVYAYSGNLNYRPSNANESPKKEFKFTDIPKDSWYYESVKFVSDRGLITGYNEGNFGPFDNLTREQLVNILWRIEGKPDASGLENKFSDVPDGTWYTDAIKWASENGIVKGHGGTTLFGVGENIIRQDLAIMLSNYAKYLDLYESPEGTLDNFADKSSVSGYAVEAVTWASENGIISGNLNADGSKTIAPLNNAMRCEASVMLTSFVTNVIYSIL